MTSKLTIVTMPPDVVRTRASSTVLVKASSRVNRDLAGMLASYHCRVVGGGKVARLVVVVAVEGTLPRFLGAIVEVKRAFQQSCSGPVELGVAAVYASRTNCAV